MRIIAGRFKGRRLTAPSWEGLRPTSDKLRETLFNVLAPRVAGARVLDGFAGTGAIGLEALSRGAAHVVFAERDRRAVALVRENLERCGVEEGYTIEHRDVGAVLRTLDSADVFDLIFLDPPYDHPPSSELLDAAGRRLAPDGLLIVERASRREPAVPPSLDRLRDLGSGDSTLTFFARRTRPIGGTI
jgi:16S rRNA (guanine(966)-N(2))-methyltransferase RsmD